MRRMVGFLTPVFVLCMIAGLAWGGDKSVAGTWECTAVAPSGEGISFTLNLKEEGGKLTGSTVSERGEQPLNGVRYENDTLKFSVEYESELYDLELKVTGAKMEGIWKGGGDSGPVHGSRKS